MALPTLRAELHNGSTWVNAGNVVRRGGVVREGYRPELQESRPGTATFTVSNASRAFDPDNAAGTHYGYLDAGCPVRLIATYSAVDYTLFTGIIDRIGQEYDPGNREAAAVVDAVDYMTLLAQRPLPSGYTAEVERADAAAVYLPLDEHPSQTYPRNPLSLTGDFAGQWGGATRQDTELMPSAPGGKRFPFIKNVLVLPPFRTAAGGWHLSFWFQIPKLTAGTWTRRLLQPSTTWSHTDSSGNLLITLSSVGSIIVRQAGSGAGQVQYTLPSWTGIGADGAQHFLVMEGAPGSGITFYLDGSALSPSASLNASSTQQLSSTQHFLAGDANDYTTPATPVLLVDELELSIGHLVSAQGTGHADRLAFVGITGTVNTDAEFWDSPAKRIDWCLDQAGVTAGAVDAGAVLLRGVRGGDLPIAHIRTVAASDGGLFWIDPTGEARYLSPPSGVVTTTFADDGSGIGYTGLSPVRDHSRRITAARAETRDGVLARYDSGSTPLREVQFNSLNLLPLDAYARCLALVESLQDAGSQYPSLSFMPATGSQWVTAFGLDLGDNVRVKRTPQGVGAAINRVCRVESIRHDFDTHASTWTTTLALGIPGPQDGFILDVSELDVGALF